MATYSLIKFKINNDFFEWEQAFYGVQYMSRKAGIIELFHGMTEDDPQTSYELAQVTSKEAMDKLFENAGEEVANSGHILSQLR